ncbi:MAG: hypothetical protein ABR907_13410 [Terracidiphilus sp.]|jgi:hypothetical protein
MATQGFQVFVSGGHVSLDDWREAMVAPEKELPELSENQREAARFVAMAESEYARGVLADELGKNRQQGKGNRLGQVVSDLLGRLGQGWKLDSLTRRGTEFVWVARVNLMGREVEAEIPLDLADDVVDSGDPSSRSRLEELLRARLEIVPRRAVS